MIGRRSTALTGSSEVEIAINSEIIRLNFTQ
jgi:hypothetical protein